MGVQNHLLLVFWIYCVGLYGLVNSYDSLNVTLRNPSESYSLESPGYPEDAPPSTDITWRLAAGPEGGTLELICNHISLVKSGNCTEAELTIWDGQRELRLCTETSEYRGRSVGPRMSVRLRTGQSGVGRLSCRVRLEETTGGDDLLDLGRETDSGAIRRHSSCSCRRRNQKRIIGGDVAVDNEYPFMVYIKRRSDKWPFCGGSILTERHILTAAHCPDGEKQVKLRVVTGGHDLKTDEKNHRTSMFEVKEIYIHPDYNATIATDDIAVLELSEEIQFSPFVAKVCLPRQRYDLVGKSVTALGWGRLSTYPTGAYPTTLRKVELGVVILNLCALVYNTKDIQIINLTDPKHICIFTPPDKGTSKGDSGGPVLYRDPESNNFIQVGIIHFGMEEDSTFHPELGVDVFAYYEWIQTRIAIPHDPGQSSSSQSNTCD